MVTATLTWTASAGALAYRTEYKLQSSGVWIVNDTSVEGLTDEITGLINGGAYDFRVISICEEGESVGAAVQENTPCVDVTGLAVNMDGSTAELSWDRKVDAVSYTIEYKLQADESWTESDDSPLTNPVSGDTVDFDIEDLDAGEAYDFRVKINCQVGQSTGATVQGNTACPNVTNLQVTFD